MGACGLVGAMNREREKSSFKRRERGEQKRSRGGSSQREFVLKTREEGGAEWPLPQLETG